MLTRTRIVAIVGVLSCVATGCAALGPALTVATQVAAATAQTQQDQTLLVFGGRGHKTFLGCLCSDYGNDSILNTYSPFGNAFSASSIFNHFGDFGSAYSEYSACSTYASDPPVIVKRDGSFIARLTLNSSIPGAVYDPQVIKWLNAVCSS
jgi:hypothetical protein